MKNHYYGLDFLRGLGIFFVVALHSSFYYFGGLYELDLNNPPPIVTIIGLLLMFAGMFAIISGTVHCIQMVNRIRRNGYSTTGSIDSKISISSKKIISQFFIRGIIIFVIAYVYFIVTGPGVVDMGAKTMDNSILVELIQNGRFTGVSFQRIFYIDSLVMLGSNIILLGLFSALILKFIKTVESIWFSRSFFLAGTVAALVSLVRIPLYEIITKALDEGNYAVFFLLNWIVNKNNPILPYIAFGFYGMWIGAMLVSHEWKKIKMKVLVVSLVLLITGIFMYVNLPDTMLERGIDMKWYSIMLAQLGLFMLMVLGALKYFDFRKKGTPKSNVFYRFITRFGVAGLTVFFIESVVSALFFRVIKLIVPGISLNLNQALIYGLSLSLFWGIILIFWEKTGYKYGLEYLYGKIVSYKGKSTKLKKLQSMQK